jgi:hypothetical protein
LRVRVCANARFLKGWLFAGLCFSEIGCRGGQVPEVGQQDDVAKAIV